MLRLIHRTPPLLPASARPPILPPPSLFPIVRTITCTPHICRDSRAGEVLAKHSKHRGGIWHKTDPNGVQTASSTLAQMKRLQKLTQDPASKATSALDLPELLGQDALKWAHKVLHSRLSMFRSNRQIKLKAGKMGIRGNLFTDIADKFTKSALLGTVRGCNAQSVLQSWDEEGGVESIDRMLVTAFFHFSEPHLPLDILSNFSVLRKLSDLKFPNEWFPEARKVQRKIHLHVGPTNSGKTHAALTRLASASAGIYCGPLRLLAHEIYERMNARGIPCNLLTGEQRIEVSPTAPLTSSTVEMAKLNCDLDVAVVDEIQMIADRARGWAWTQALLGLRAQELHLCGEPSAVPLVMNIALTLGEEVEVHKYQRLTPLVLADSSLGGTFENVRRGDCMVTFSRRDIFAAKKRVEQTTGLKCAVVYGNLPPETRALQAKLFNNPESGFDVLVASDAIGMGLNLNIKRIVFETIDKYDGKNFRRIAPPQLRQIAGRAGRFGTQFETGEVTTLVDADLPYLKQAMEAPVDELEMAGLQPTVEILEMFSAQLPGETFSNLLVRIQLLFNRTIPRVDSNLDHPSTSKNLKTLLPSTASTFSATIGTRRSSPTSLSISPLPFTTVPFSSQALLRPSKRSARMLSSIMPLTTPMASSAS
ncbi:LOW QUALITY PROTEIN: hypothetical protein BC937DRAFT_92399 [Endogone sp. FLAS-F59071]|nr:LOW QUALITY PROTEIN: hypothetical protein BC937DRAFT_92399 [Endogone sp. FLAS-F59071]|eukprot:RUS23097.1 LOW QUALITY PROTEIN: hypothetical protein BC937DRAFT_92399 [Endogone sp. FLAS-F59071]